MPRRPATIERDIPLYLVPHKIQQGVHTYGERLERVVVNRGSSHYYNVSIRTRPVKRELRSSWRRGPGLRVPPESVGDADSAMKEKTGWTCEEGTKREKR